jgi:transcription elongation factor Elf1
VGRGGSFTLLPYLLFLDLSAAVDVYSDWVDACDAVAKGGGAEVSGDYAPSRTPAAAKSSAARARSEEDDDNDIIDDEDDTMGYGGEGVVGDDEY